MKLFSVKDNTAPVICFIIIIVPFVMMYWMVPFATDLTLGKDYQEFSIQNQMELLFSIKTGAFPLYVPGYAFGHSSSALTLGQVFHPLPHIASHLPGYWNGKALEWNTFLRLLSLGFAHLALFVFLRNIKLDALFSFLLSLITIYNMRMLDLFRFGASLETYTGFILLCTSIGLYCIKPTKWKGPVYITGATYWLVCSGHPTMMYYGLLGTGLFLCVAPFFLPTIHPHRRINFKEALVLWLKTGLFIFCGILLSSAYILPFYFDFIATNTLRVAQNYDFSLSYETFFGTLSNFFMPLFSDIHGAFGGSSLFLMMVILPLLRCFRIRIPASVWVVWGLVLFMFLYMQGARTPVHRWAWDHLPFASSVRGEGRISLIIPFFIMLLLAWIIKLRPFSFRIRDSYINLVPYVPLALISLVLFSLYVLLSAFLNVELGAFPPKYIRHIPFGIIAAVSILGAFSLLTLLSYYIFPQHRRLLGIVLCLMTCIQIGGILKYGTFVAPRHDQPSFEKMKEWKKSGLIYPYNPGAGMYSSVISRQLSNSFLEPFLGKIYTEVIPVSSREEAYELMADKLLPHQVFIEGFDREMADEINKDAKHMRKGTVKLLYSSFNRLQFGVYSEAAAVFGLSYPYSGYWDAMVNGNKVRVYRSNGASHSVVIPKGDSLIEFRYWSPAAFYGIIISCATFIFVGLYVCLMYMNGFPKIIAAAVIIMLGLGGVTVWKHSLYRGDNLDTRYVWTYTPPEQKTNLFYGKKISISPSQKDIWYQMSRLYRNHTSKIVDGEKRRGTGYSIILGNNPPLIVDLRRKHEIKSITIYKSVKNDSSGKRQLKIFASPDKNKWDNVVSLNSISDNHEPIFIEFNTSINARYVKIKASGKGLSLDEIEAYGE